MTRYLDQNSPISRADSSSGWWVFPVALLLVTLVVIVAASLITGTGQDTGDAGVGSAGGGQEVTAPAGGQRR